MKDVLDNLDKPWNRNGLSINTNLLIIMKLEEK